MKLVLLHRVVTGPANAEQKGRGLEEITYEQGVSVSKSHIMWVEDPFSGGTGKVRVGLSDGTIWTVRETVAEIEALISE